MRRISALAAAVLGGCLWPSFERVELYCDDEVGCNYASAPEARFCDADGSVAGIANTCIAVPAGRCTENADCDLGEVCGAQELRCRSCAEHAECDSLACDREAGACFEESRVVYVDAARGADGDCGTRAEPCATIMGSGGAVDEVSGGSRDVIKLLGSVNEAVSLSLDVHLVGPAAITRPSDQPAVAVTGGSVVLDDLEVSGGRGPAGAAVSCSGAELEIVAAEVSDDDQSGVVATDCALSIERSLIAGNLGGGLSVAGSSFVVRNNFIVDNGDNGSAFGGASLESTVADSIFELNTVAGNRAASASESPSVSCEVPMTAVGNLVFANIRSGGGVNGPVGSCNWRLSNLLGGPPAGSDAGENIDADPLFLDPGAGDYHIQPDSPCRDVLSPAEVGSDIDFDGDRRPLGTLADCGADEVADAN